MEQDSIARRTAVSFYRLIRSTLLKLEIPPRAPQANLPLFPGLEERLRRMRRGGPRVLCVSC